LTVSVLAFALEFRRSAAGDWNVTPTPSGKTEVEAKCVAS